MSDYYSILGVNKSASTEEIKKSYRKKSLEYHPDRPTGNSEKFKKISEAYETLGDNQKRQMYDMQRENPFMGGGGFPGFAGHQQAGSPDDIFKMFFGGGGPDMFGHGGPNIFGAGGPGIRVSMNRNPMGQRVHIFRNGQPVHIPQKPDNLEKKIEIDIKQSYFGGKVPLEIERTIINYNERRKEKETIYVDIPIGIDNNEIITIKEKGNVLNDEKGDIKLSIRVVNKTDFKREGMNLVYEKQISLKESLVGFTFNIKHLSGKDYTINNNTGKVVTNTHMNVIKNMGMRREQKHPASPLVGDLIIKFKVLYPDTITDEQRNALSEIL
jgi:DnaJ-class molecular chaperone